MGKIRQSKQAKTWVTALDKLESLVLQVSEA